MLMKRVGLATILSVMVFVCEAMEVRVAVDEAESSPGEDIELQELEDSGEKIPEELKEDFDRLFPGVAQNVKREVERSVAQELKKQQAGPAIIRRRRSDRNSAEQVEGIEEIEVGDPDKLSELYCALSRVAVNKIEELKKAQEEVLAKKDALEEQEKALSKERLKNLWTTAVAAAGGMGTLLGVPVIIWQFFHPISITFDAICNCTSEVIYNCSSLLI